MRTVAIIPARGGSKGIPGKNVKPLGGIPLVARSIRAANAAVSVDEVFVSTDDGHIRETALAWGARVVDRPAEISGDGASSESAVLHALDKIEKDGTPVDIVVFLQCTSPFTSPADIDAVVAALADGSDCAFSVKEDHGFLWRIDGDGAGVGINHDESAPRQRRQDLEPQFRETGAIYAMNVAAFRKRGVRFCGRAVPVALTTPSLEIDDPSDWHVAEAMAHRMDARLMAETGLSGIRTIVTDFDGVHTDDRVLVDQDGREAVMCSRRDGMGIELLRNAGFRILVLSKETNQVVARRAQKLNLEVIHGVDAKHAVLSDWLAQNDLTWNEIAFVGNDINDVDCMKAARLSLCPADSHIEALVAADMVLPEAGGHGALRTMAELFLSSIER
ncbi:acylneuraminate cytidylyltransferase [Croceicoccus sediminis]|uniref:acylneuraminate cytidylyltransferase n=1 Tax=Croceicoccus sediminis TaxID=2571150 RepID=UPI001182CC93|nr:acylneuraminate cytidylyltransferase [Croceicoccus sediminis]